MLVLSRRVGERVVIGDSVDVTVLSIQGSRVRIGINAPNGVSILREELWIEMQEENSTTSTPSRAAAC